MCCNSTANDKVGRKTGRQTSLTIIRQRFFLDVPRAWQGGHGNKQPAMSLPVVMLRQYHDMPNPSTPM
jgi:hypothetical protein